MTHWARVKRVAASLIVVVLSYGAYALVVVPWIEPELVQRTHAQATGPQAQVKSTDRFQDRLEQLFPEGAWELQDAKVLHNAGTSLLFQDYQPRPDGSVHVFPCTAVIDRGSNSDLAETRSSALILQAPEGAVLRLDKPLDLKSAQIGKPVAARLVGQITIKSCGGPPDEPQFELRTSNVQINRQQLLTPHEVMVVYGNSRLRGKDLIIKLLPDQGPRSNDKGLAGIRSVELIKLEHLYLDLPRDLTDPPDGQGDPRGNRPPGESFQLDAPVEVKCAGPCRVDFLENVATFEDQVRLRRLNRDAPEDTLECDLLSLFLTETVAGEPNSKKVPKLTVQRVVAEGRPAQLDAPSQKAFVQGSRLLYDLLDQRFRLWANPNDARDQAYLRHDFSELTARELDCVIGPEQSIEQITAAGPGRVQSQASTTTNSGPFEASWNGKLHLEPVDTGHLLTVTGDVNVGDGAGRRVNAEEFRLWLEPAPQVLTPRQQRGFPFRPSLLIASAPASDPRQTPVRISSPELSGATERLEVKFVHRPPVAAANTNAASDAFPALNSPQQPSRAAPRPPQAKAAEPTGDPLYVSGRAIGLTVRLAGSTAVLDQVTLSDDARLKQFQRDRPGVMALQVAADAVQVQDTDGRGSYVVTATGRPVDVLTEQFRMQSNELRLNRRQNLLTVPGGGRMSVDVDRDLQGRPLAEVQRATVDWRGQMTFDGGTIRFVGDVDVRGPTQRVLAQQLALALNRFVNFSSPSQKGQGFEIRQIQADGNVVIESREVQEGQLDAIIHAQVPHFLVNRLSGDCQAEGPGRLVVVRRGFSNRIDVPGRTPARPANSDGRLTFLQVDYQGQIQGNLNRHVMEFQRQVEVAYGPVSSWNQTIDPNAPLGPDDVLLTCDHLTLSQGPPTQTNERTMAVAAQGNTYVEGQTFTARGDRVSYEQVKDLLILEGLGRTDAVLSHQTRVGAPRSETAARKILFWPHTQRVEVNDARYLDLSNLGL